MEVFDWVSEGSIQKFHRAVAELKAKKADVTEDAVKALYVKYGGLVVEKVVESDESGEEKIEEIERPRRGRPFKSVL
jgi:hypothetical protein